MAESKHKSGESGIPAAAQNLAGQSLMGGAEAVLAAQNEWLAAMEGSVTGWLHRRREALEHARQALERVPQCRTLADLTELQQQWFSEVSRQLAGDMAAWSDTTRLLSQLAMKHVDEAGRIVAAGSSLGQRELLKAAGDKPSQGRAAPT